jgi:hypothetical protein
MTADNPNRSRLLEEAIAFGGEPVGWYRFKDGKLEMGTFQEYGNKEGAHEHLNALLVDIKAAIKDEGR